MNKLNKKTCDSQELMKLIQVIHNKIDVLSENINKINNEIISNKTTIQNELKDIKNQNTIILDVLAENTAAMKSCIKNNIPKYTKTFPISSVDEFQKVEETLNEENEKEYIASIRAICGQRGIKKGLRDIIKPEVLDLYNLDGTHNKLRLLNFRKFMHVLFAGTYCEGNTDKTFKSDIRDALKIAKNRYCKEKKKSAASKENTTSTEDDFFEKHYNLLINS
ncbi:uncharacterized protein LOC119601895 [Lucilia sericata]|uniref:uncharacterized protein LOC119601895 n=1 Tax=Lucilia sericata TaxID=13632 RepID=UPI0018A7FBFC|nr:uncharacterized protein LOC119601895 [Lucilia sericata]